MPRKAAPWFRANRGWYVTIQGKKTRLGVSDPNDEQAAWEAFKAILAKANGNPAARPEPIAQLAAEWLDSFAHRVQPKTLADYAVHLRRLVARFGMVPAGHLDAGTIEKSADPKWSDSHRSNYLWVCQAFLRWAGCTSLKLARPAKESRGADAVISPEIHAKVLREVAGDFGAFVRFLWVTGCRPMEAASLTAEGVDWTSGTATLKRHKTRHKGRTRILYLSSEALAILAEQRDRHDVLGYLFRGMYGKPFSRQAVVTRFQRVSAKIGQTVTAYQYRHSFCNRALAAGVSDTVVAALMGHASTNMIHRHYAHIHAQGRLLRQVADSLSKAAG